MTAADEVRSRGWAILEGLYAPGALDAFRDAVDRIHASFGAPALTARHPIWLDDHVEVAGPGFAVYQLLRYAPELAPHLFAEPAVDALRALLGPTMHLELVGAVMSDETRPFTEWESHLGGIDDERWRKEGKRPRQDAVRRVVHFLFLEDLDEVSGPWRALPRAVGDPVDPPASIHELDWPGVEEITAPAGSVLLLEESVWHAVVPRRAPGRRRFIGAYFASPEAAPTVGRDTSLDALDVDDPRLRELLANRPPDSKRS